MTTTPLRTGVPPAGGILIIDKPEGPTSHDVVARARRSLGVRQIGHTGTLDPMATGVLALVVGRATRLAQFLSGHEKKYVARIRLGMSTDSWDRTGAIVSQLEPGVPLPGLDDVATVLHGCLGEQEQVPPAFSAKKLGGVPAYELARRGRAVEMTAARVTLHHATVEAFSAPFVDVRLTCSAGFYVRALADTLGQRLGCGACLDALCRTASGPFTLERAIPLARLEEAPDGAVGRLVPPEQALPGMPTVVLTEDGVRRALHGNEVGPRDWIEQVPSVELRVSSARLGTRNSEHGTGFVKLLAPDGRLLAIARPSSEPGVLHPAVVLG